MLQELKGLLAADVQLSPTIIVKSGKKMIRANFERVTLDLATKTASLEYRAVEEPKAMQANGQRKASKGVAK